MRDRLRTAVLAAVLTCASAAPAAAQTAYTWQDTAATWTTPAAWTPTGPDWTSAAGLTDAVAVFGNRAAITNQPSIGAATVFARGVTFDNTGADWSLAGTGVLGVGSGGISWTGVGTSAVTANVRVVADQTWDIGTTTVTHTGILSGYGTLTKSGSGTLVLDNQGNLFTGGLVITAGKVQVGSTTSNAGSVALRNTAVTLSSGATLAVGGSSNLNMRVGAISGTGGTVTAATGTGTLVQNLTADGSFAGVLTAGNLSVAGPGTQTYTGNVAGVNGTVSAYSGGAVVFAGAGSGSGVISATALDLRGGAVVLDNAGGNTTSAAGRVPSSPAVTALGGTLRLIGDPSAGTAEAVGRLTVNGGQTTIDVVHTGGPGGTALTFSSATLTGSGGDRGTVDFTNSSGSGTLGTAGANPRVVLTGVTGNLGPRFTVNGADYAAHGANGVGPVTYDATLANVGTTTGTSSQYLFLNQAGLTNATKSGPGNLSAAGFKILPGAAGQTLDITGTGNLNVTGLLLAGANDYTIRTTGTGTGGIAGSVTQFAFVGVGQAGTTLTIATGLKTAGADVVKYGPGVLSLTGDNVAALNSGSNVTDFYINAGTLRVTVGSANASLPNGTNTSVSFRGGVLEIANGANGTGAAADFVRGLGTPNTGGTVNWNAGSTDRGEGGFAAYNTAASVSIGGATPTTLTWDGAQFLTSGQALLLNSTTATARITLLNPVALDPGPQAAYFQREVRVADNPNSATDLARIAGVISGSSQSDLLKTGAGTLELTGANTYAGNTLVLAGTLRVGDGATGGRLGSGGGQVVVSAGATLAFNRSDAVAVTNLIAGPGAVTQAGTGTLTPAATNTYTGPTTVGGGILAVTALANGGQPSSLGAAPTAATNLVLAGGTLQYTGPAAAATDRLLSLGAAVSFLDAAAAAGPVSFTSTGSLGFTGTGARTLTLSASNAGTNTFAPAIGDAAPGSPTTLAKSGAGTWALTGANTYTGPTTVTGGTLLVNGNQSAATGPVTVGTGAANTGTLAGFGALGGAVTVNPGGTFRPGDDTPANPTLTVANTLTVAGGGTLGIRLFSGTPSTGVNGSSSGTGTNTRFTLTAGALTLDPAAVVAVDATGAGLADGTAYSFQVGQTTGTTPFAFNTPSQFSTTGFTTAPGNFTLFGDGNGAVYLNFGPAAVPEPAAVGLIAAAALLLRRRRRRGERPG